MIEFNAFYLVAMVMKHLMLSQLLLFSKSKKFVNTTRRVLLGNWDYSSSPGDYHIMHNAFSKSVQGDPKKVLHGEKG